MSNTSTLNNLVNTKTVTNTLKKGSGAKTEVKALQHVLHDLGYSKELNWDKYGADGGYGGSTTAAMTEFLKRNGLAGSGDAVSEEAGKKLVELSDVVDDMRQIKELITNKKVESNLQRGSKDKPSIVALQTILNTLGYGTELNWNKYGADGDYGGSSTAAVKAFATKEGFASDGMKVTEEMATRMLSKFEGGLGDSWSAASSGSGASGEGLQGLSVSKIGSYQKVSDGVKTVKFKMFRKGVYTYGSEKMADFIASNKDTLDNLGITESAMNVMLAVSENEGNLDAINTWDNSFMTFGMFQWTIGARKDKGELPALLKKIKDAEPEIFQKYYGTYGLDVWDGTGEVYGYTTLNGVRMRLESEKAQFRTPQWSYVFWRAGHDDFVKAVEIEHALSRLNSFYWRTKINGFAIADIITSEFGVGLILDNHVNRPGYVKPCIQKAMEKTGLMNPTNWTTEDEMKVVEAYIKIRATYGGSPMTHANNRAKVTRKYLNNGTISKERKSFEFTYTASRDASSIGVAPDAQFNQDDYDIIRGFEDEFTDYE